MRVALLCDVDQRIYHVGDEAIATRTSDRLRARGAQPVRISRHEKYGPGAGAPEGTIPALTFPWPIPERATYLAEIRAVLAGRRDALPPQDKVFGIIEALRGVDALVIGGGGSLTSRYGWLLDERLATALIAHHLGTPVVLSGQSLGPELTPGDRAAAAELLSLCTLVGLRDAESTRLARELSPAHPAIVHTLDDAVGLGTGPQEAAPALEDDLISVTLGADPDPFPREDYLAVIAAVLEALVARTGARLELVPHMADPDEGGADLELLAALSEQLRTPARLLPIESDTVSAERTARARWVVSTRFHPVVFATTAGAQVLALPLNRYGARRMDGALAAAGLAGAAVPLAALWDPGTGGPTALVDEVVEAFVAGAEAERGQLLQARPTLLAAGEQWWDTVVEVLRGSPPAVTDPAGAGIAAQQRWPEALQQQLAPWTTLVDAPRPDPSAAIILRTRDRPAMLDRALQDVLAQSRADWELVVVDDAGDHEQVAAVCARHEHEAAGRLRLLRRETSTGMEAASNAGLHATSAPAIAIHDDDDTWHATFLQETLAHLAAHPRELAVVVRTTLIHERELPTGFVEDEAFPSWPELQGVRLLDYLQVNRHVPIAMLHRRSVHEAIGDYDESLPVVGDYAFHLALLEHGEIGFLERPLAQWRHRLHATGAAGNSMIRDAQGHRTYDGVLREQHLRAWTQEHGLGLPLFIAQNTQAQLETRQAALLTELRGLDEQVRATREELGALRALLEQPSRGLGARIRARLGRVRRSLRGSEPTDPA